MNSYGHILVPKRESYVPKVTNLACFGPKPYLKTSKAQFFFIYQNDCLVEIIEAKKRVKNFKWGAVMVT